MTEAAAQVAHRGLSLRIKILIVLTIFNIVATLVFTFSQYNAAKNRYMEGLARKLEVVTRALPEMLGETYLDRAVNAQAIADAEYLAVVKRLSAFAESTGLLYVYTYSFVDGAFFCTSSNGTPEELVSGKYTRYWQRYDSAPESIFVAAQTGEPQLAEVDDEWGQFYTLFAPMQTAGGTRYIAGADLAIAEIQSLRRETLYRAALNGLGVFVILLLVSSPLSSSLSRNISVLAAYTQEYSGARFEAREDSELRAKVADIHRRMGDEVGLLAGSFLSMQQQLAAYLTELAATTAAKERIQNELRIAGEIQASMLPHEFVAPSGEHRLELYGAMKPAKEAGGDFYDVITLDEDHICFAIADVSDKGVPAALFMTVAITILRACATAELRERPDEILRQVNDLLCQQNPMCQFVTVFIGIANRKTGRLVCSDGGHNPPFLVRAGQPAQMLPAGQGTALGIMDGIEFPRFEVALELGDMLYCYTDGVTEAVAVDESFYGEERLARKLATMGSELDARSLTEAGLADVYAFAEGHAQADDITVLVVRMPPGMTVAEAPSPRLVAS